MNHQEIHQDNAQVIIDDEEIEQLKFNLPKATYMNGKLDLLKYQNSWCPSNLIKNILMFQRLFQAQNTDLIIASLPKTGTTWLKSLLFAVVDRGRNPIHQSPLLGHNPHDLVYSLEYDIYGQVLPYPKPHHLHELRLPRLLHTHLPYKSLPESIKTSACRILYICRNPLDTFVSQLHYYHIAIKKQIGQDFELPSMEDFFEGCYQGIFPHGPFFDHAIEYWKRSLEEPDRVLFLKYEDLKDDPTAHVKMVAKFVGMPFSPDEERQGVIRDTVQFCSINNLKELEVNKSGIRNKYYEKKSFFRKGEVGDWMNYFSPEMMERMKKLMDEKLEGTGLSFKLHSE